MAKTNWRNRVKALEYHVAGDILDHPHQWRTHPAKQAEALRDVLDEVGVAGAMLVYASERADGKLVRIDGHGRKDLDPRATWPCLVLDVDDHEADLLLATYDPIGAQAGADAAKLDELLRGVSTGSAALQSLLGEVAERAGVNGKPPVGEDAGPQIDRAEELRVKWGTATGQLWELGEHRLICGDCTDAAVVARVMGGERASICLTDPPYGLGDGKASGKNDYDQHEDTRDNLVVLAKAWLPIARSMCGAVVFSPGVTNAWIYPEADWVMSWFYGGGQLRSPWGFNCWQPFLCYGKDPSLATGHGGRPDAVDMNVPANAGDIDHPCPKPLKLWEWFVERLSFEKGAVFYDPFLGSGTTLIACERLGRRCRAVEISPGYVAVALQRWSDMTGKTPRLIDNLQGDDNCA